MCVSCGSYLYSQHAYHWYVGEGYRPSAVTVACSKHIPCHLCAKAQSTCHQSKHATLHCARQRGTGGCTKQTQPMQPGRNTRDKKLSAHASYFMAVPQGRQCAPDTMVMREQEYTTHSMPRSLAIQVGQTNISHTFAMSQCDSAGLTLRRTYLCHGAGARGCFWVE